MKYAPIIAAVSALRVVLPREMISKPDDFDISISSKVHPPSGPTQTPVWEFSIFYFQFSNNLPDESKKILALFLGINWMASLKETGSYKIGITPRPDCSAASL